MDMEAEKVITVKPYTSPIGVLLLGSLEDRLCLCDWRITADTTAHSRRIDHRLQARLSATYQEGTSKVIEAVQSQLEEYFAGKRTSFHVPLLLSGTDFQLRVWKELLQIPYGVSLSYGELACRIGKPAAVRAVANANNANPLSVLVPCHRVIGSHHQLTGYGGGLELKRQLLCLESGRNGLWKAH